MDCSALNSSTMLTKASTISIATVTERGKTNSIKCNLYYNKLLPIHFNAIECDSY